MAKSFHSYKEGTKKKALRIAKRMNVLCLNEESNGHGRHWSRDECNEIMFLAMRQLNIDYDESRVQSWFRKIRKATMTRNTDNVYEMPPLDLCRDDDGRLCYVWLRHGELPIGFIVHLSNISMGVSPEIFDDIISLAGSNIDELVEKAGAKTALNFAIEARKTAYFLHRGKELEQLLYVLSALEKEIASRLDRETWNAAQEFMTKQLPAPSHD